MEEEVLPIIPMVRVYYSSYHLWAAKHFLELCSEIEDANEGRSEFNIKHRAYVTNSIFSAVGFIEAAINELFQDCHDDHEPYINTMNPNGRAIIKDYWGMTEGEDKSISLLDKYQLALRFCDLDIFPKGEAPYQDVNYLIKIRNTLTYYKPKTLGGETIHRLENQLKNRFPENKLMESSGNPYFPDKALGKGCAGWAVQSAVRFVDLFFSKINVIPNYKLVNF